MTTDEENSEQAFLTAIKTTPIIDHHAHPLLKPAYMGKRQRSMLSLTSEAHGHAQKDANTQLSHFRAVKQLAAILGCDENWVAVTKALNKKHDFPESEKWIGQCLSDIQMILVDDGLDHPENSQSYRYFDNFTGTRSKRIVRIEEWAAEWIEKMCLEHPSADKAFSQLMKQYMAAVVEWITDPEVVAFKSVICYRTGLALGAENDLVKATRAFRMLYQERTGPKGQPFTRLNHPGLSEYFVHRLAQLIEETPGVSYKKPIQFHTGLGDNDIVLAKSSPAYMQEFIKAHPSVPIVLLHSGYPFNRETAYLATVYSNVYADIGELFPVLSRDGQESVLREVLELCPGSKLLWSTDGHWFPETFLLATKQIRLALLNVLSDWVLQKDLTWAQAGRLVKNMLFNNANMLYNLKLDPRPVKPTYEANSMTVHHKYLTRFLQGKDEPKFLRVYWNDFTAQPRMRAIPMRRVWSMLQKGEKLAFGVTKASLGLLQNDVPVPGVVPAGEYFLCPDICGLRMGPRKGHITAMGDFMDGPAGPPAELCPRSLLRDITAKAEREKLPLLFGFEIELLLVRRDEDDRYRTLNIDGHAWSVGRAMDNEAAISVIEEAILRLEEADVFVEMVHPESASGQYEIVLPRASPLEAVDTLLFARDVISSCASAKGFKMTLHPKPFPTACGTAAHVHMSIASEEGNEESTYEHFYAGILKHLPAIAAFTYSNPVSYERVQDGCWAGGTWVTWGTQNRETPLRKIAGSHWELKCMDGLANPYLAMAAVVACGMDGVGCKEEMLWKDCTVDPATLDDEQRVELNVVKKLPKNLSEALAALQDDDVLSKHMGKPLIERYAAVKKAELEMLESMNPEDRRQWIMERY